MMRFSVEISGPKFEAWPGISGLNLYGKFRQEVQVLAMAQAVVIFEWSANLDMTHLLIQTPTGKTKRDASLALKKG